MLKKNADLVTFILGVLFFIFGFVTWLNGTLIQYLKIACQLNAFQSLLVAFAFYISYFVMALPSSWILQKTGFKKGMALGLIIMAVGMLLFVPAAYSRAYILFLIGLFVIGTGLSLLQTASNPYITIAGPLESAAKRISIMGVCNKFAAVLSPFVLGALILSDADKLVNNLQTMSATQSASLLNALALRVVAPYSIMGIILAILAIGILVSPLPEIKASPENEESNFKSSIWSHFNLIYGAIALFFYVGVEVIAGDTIGSYGHSLGMPLAQTRSFTAYTMIAMVIGYLIGIFTIPRYISQQKALRLSAIAGIILSLVALFTQGYVSVLFIALLGIANAPIWPAIWPLALKGLGKYTKTGSALLIMAIAGGALLPLAYGKLADIPAVGYHAAYTILIPCYLIILWYSLRGEKLPIKKKVLPMSL